MKKTEKTVWTAPALRKLGTIGDVAGSINGTVQNQAPGNPKS